MLCMEVSPNQDYRWANIHVTAPQAMADEGERAQQAAKPFLAAHLQAAKMGRLFSRAQPRIGRFFNAVGLKAGHLVS